MKGHRGQIIYIIIALLGFTSVALGQRLYRNQAFEAYIRKHYTEAVRQMNKHGIPASITMAQGIVETGAGKSSLAVDFNNHFGIKCHTSWRGKRTYKTDDAPNECFRHYDSWEESYEDHSIFLKGRRYLPLFALRLDDYKGWAIGLQSAGYATNKGYANKLINIIEIYELYMLDFGKLPSWMDEGEATVRSTAGRGKAQHKEQHKTKVPEKPLRPIYMSYGLLYVLADPSDTLEKIAEEVGISPRKLARYNDMPEGFTLQEADVVYLERKHRRASEAYVSHKVKIGDSMHSIAQRYGIRLDDLYRMNDKDGDYIPTEGDVLLLR